MPIQEIINEIVRRRIFMQPVETKKSKVGRFPKIDEPFMEYFSRNRKIYKLR